MYRFWMYRIPWFQWINQTNFSHKLGEKVFLWILTDFACGDRIYIYIEVMTSHTGESWRGKATTKQRQTGTLAVGQVHACVHTTDHQHDVTCRQYRRASRGLYASRAASLSKSLSATTSAEGRALRWRNGDRSACTPSVGLNRGRRARRGWSAATTALWYGSFSRYAIDNLTETEDGARRDQQR